MLNALESLYSLNAAITIAKPVPLARSGNARQKLRVQHIFACLTKATKFREHPRLSYPAPRGLASGNSSPGLVANFHEPSMPQERAVFSAWRPFFGGESKR